MVFSRVKWWSGTNCDLIGIEFYGWGSLSSYHRSLSEQALEDNGAVGKAENDMGAKLLIAIGNQGENKDLKERTLTPLKETIVGARAVKVTEQDAVRKLNFRILKVPKYVWEEQLRPEPAQPEGAQAQIDSRVRQ